MRIQLTFGETRAGSWDRPELAALAPVLGRPSGRPRTLVVELVARPAAADEPVDASFEIRSPDGGRPSRDNLAVLEAVRRMNPLVWLRRGVLVEVGRSWLGRGECADDLADAVPAAAEVLRR